MQGLAGGPQTTGRTIIMTEPKNLPQEMVNAEALGRRVVGLEFDFPNHESYIICEPATRALPLWPVADTQTWIGRLRALDAACPDRPAVRRTMTPLEMLVAWFRGRRGQGTALVQEGGAR